MGWSDWMSGWDSNTEEAPETNKEDDKPESEDEENPDND